jgi:hypothetical protein
VGHPAPDRSLQGVDLDRVHVPLLTAACRESISIESTGSGYYTLQTVDGAELPFVASQTGTDFVRLDDGQLALRSDGSYEEDLIYDVARDGTLTQRVDVARGTWTGGTDGTVTFTEVTPTQRTYSAAAFGAQLTLSESPDGWPAGPHVLVYSR